jgi:hypothetical protein
LVATQTAGLSWSKGCKLPRNWRNCAFEAVEIHIFGWIIN